MSPPTQRARLRAHIVEQELLLTGVGFKNYGCFSRGTTWLAPLAKLSVLAGPNNAGKSTLLSAVADSIVHNRVAFHDVSWRHSVDYQPLRASSDSFEAAIVYRDPDQVLEATLRKNDGFGLKHWRTERADLTAVELREPQSALVVEHQRADGSVWAEPTTPTDVEIPNILRGSVDRSVGFPVILVPARRAIGQDEISTEELLFSDGMDRLRAGGGTQGYAAVWDGRWLARGLLHFASPPAGNVDFPARYQRFLSFVSAVLGTPALRVRPTAGDPDFALNEFGAEMSLQRYGTGTQNLFVIAAAATLNDRSLILIEEPELHLHPHQQRLLIQELRKTSNQYIITTHSPHILDIPDTALFRVEQDANGVGGVRRIEHPSSRFGLAEMLGIRASDLVQSNAVVWVEGPSDAIYLRHWLAVRDEQLRGDSGDVLMEGVHFTFVFYGGSLGTHYSADDDTESEASTVVDRWLGLLPVNRHVVYVADSDRDAEGAALKPHVERLRNGVEENGGVAWITHGREIENVLKPEVLRKAVQQARPKQQANVTEPGLFDRAWQWKRADGKTEKVNKVDLARAYVKLAQESGELGVRDEELASIDGVVRKLRGWSGLVCPALSRTNVQD